MSLLRRRPAVGASFASAPVTVANSFVLIDVTALVNGWLASPVHQFRNCDRRRRRHRGPARHQGKYRHQPSGRSRCHRNRSPGNRRTRRRGWSNRSQRARGCHRSHRRQRADRRRGHRRSCRRGWSDRPHRACGRAWRHRGNRRSRHRWTHRSDRSHRTFRSCGPHRRNRSRRSDRSYRRDWSHRAARVRPDAAGATGPTGPTGPQGTNGPTSNQFNFDPTVHPNNYTVPDTDTFIYYLVNNPAGGWTRPISFCPTPRSRAGFCTPYQPTPRPQSDPGHGDSPGERLDLYGNRWPRRKRVTPRSAPSACSATAATHWHVISTQ